MLIVSSRRATTPMLTECTGQKKARRALTPGALFFIVFAMTMSHVAVERAVFQEGTTRRVHSRQRAFDGRVDFVIVPVAVTDSAGRSVTGLRQSDFEIFEDGLPREIRRFATDRVPVSVAVLLDASSSMSPPGERWAIPRRAVTALAAQLTSQDEAMLIAFDDTIRGLTGWTRDLASLLHKVGSIGTGGQTALFRAVAATVPALAGAQHTRRAILVVSDGNDNTATRDDMIPLMRAIDELRRSEAVLYALGANSDGRANSKNLTDLAQPTGGYVEVVGNAQTAEVAIVRMLDDLRGRYVLGFEASFVDGKFHRITVRARNNQYRVRARAGYVAARSAEFRDDLR